MVRIDGQGTAVYCSVPWLISSIPGNINHGAPAVEYLQANRVRRIAMQEMARILAGVDVFLTPTFGDNLRITNLTGHPAVVVPNGFRANGTPTSVTFCGNLFQDSEAMLLARAYQEATEFHLRHPVL